jgi:hypothetical protein
MKPIGLKSSHGTLRGKARVRSYATSMGMTSPKGASRFPVDAQRTGYGGTSPGNVPHRSVRKTSACGVIPHSSSHRKQGRKSGSTASNGSERYGPARLVGFESRLLTGEDRADLGLE